MILDEVRLGNARLVAELHEDQSLPFLRLHSIRLPGRDMLLPLRDQPLCGAMACFTPLGRLHALYWSLAYGRVDATQPYAVHFSNSGRIGRPARDAELVPLGDDWWLADVEGLFRSVTIQMGTLTVAQATIPTATRG